jgi:hypothetical protein
MPDSFEHMPSLAIRMPNGALTSIAGNVDANHDEALHITRKAFAGPSRPPPAGRQSRPTAR